MGDTEMMRAQIAGIARSSPPMPPSVHQKGRPVMGTFVPSPHDSATILPPTATKGAGVAPPLPPARNSTLHSPAAPPPSRAAAIVATKAIRRGTNSTIASASSCATSKNGTSVSRGAGSSPSSGAGGSSSRNFASLKDSKRRAEHSQIERRRREKINDRLITLRNLVPACAEELASKLRADSSGNPSQSSIDTNDRSGTADGGNEGKRRRRTRGKKVIEEASKAGQSEVELGLHKLDVLTHTIDYIYQLQAKIEELQTTHDSVEAVEPRSQDFVEGGHEVKADVLLTSSPCGAAPSHGFTPIKDSKAHARSLSVSSETASEVSLPSPLDQTLTSPYYDTSPHFGPTSYSTRGTNTPSSSALSSITSPFMSLSASSPIFAGTKRSLDVAAGGNIANVSAAPFALPPSALPLHDLSRVNSSGSRPEERAALHGSTSSMREDIRHKENGVTVADENGEAEAMWRQYTQHQPHAHDEGERPETDASSAAHLLLAISTSPDEALRPVGSRHSASDRWTNYGTPLKKRRSFLVSARSPQVSLEAASSSHHATGARERRKIPGSAPGGAHATSFSTTTTPCLPLPRGTSLPSPPLLALDDHDQMHMGTGKGN